MDPVTVGTIAEGVGSLADIGFGIADRIQGKREYKKAQSFFEKNKFAIPESAKASLSNAQRNAQGVTLPGEDILRQRLSETTSGAVGSAQTAATSAADVLGVLGDVYGNQMRGEQDILLAGANRYDKNQAILRGELGNMAQLENQKWEMNVLNPYLQMLNRAGQFQERGAAGIGMGLQGLGDAGANYSKIKGAEQSQEELYKLLGIG